MKDEANIEKERNWKNIWLFKPEQMIRFGWEMFVMIILIILGFLIPFISAFEPTNIELSNSVDILCLVIFSLDIFINFNTGYYEKDVLVMDRTKIFKNYLIFWFWLDLFSTIPIDWILQTEGTNNPQASKLLHYIRILRVLKLLKLIRLTRLKIMILKIQDRISNKKILSVINILKLLLYLLLLAHFNACIMYTVSSENDQPNSFISQIVNKSDEIVYSINEIYVSCLYWAFVTMCSIGYGDYAPSGLTERIFGILTMMTSSGLFGFIIGNIGTIIEKQGMKQRLRRETIVNLNVYMKKNKFSNELADKTRKCMEYILNHDRNDSINLNQLLSALSQPLQEEIMMHTNGSVINQCPSFSVFSHTLIHRFAKVMDIQIYSPADSLIKEGTSPKGMFFISNGLIEVYDQSTHCRIQLLSAGNYVGEIGLFLQQGCVASASSLNFSEALFLGVQDFQKIIDNYALVKEMVKEIRDSCREGNYSALKIKCYLCKKSGHIAKNCHEILNDDKFKRDWVSRNEFSKLVNLENKKPKSFVRKDHGKTHRRDYSAKNILGAKRKPREMFPKVTSLVRGIVNYIKNKQRFQNGQGYVFTEESISSNFSINMFKHPEWILSSDEENQELENLCSIRDKFFDISLIK